MLEHPDARVGLQELYEAYKSWAEFHNEFVKDFREFNTSLEGRGDITKKRSGKKGNYQWHGICLHDSTEGLNLTEPQLAIT